jgi:hypothetical protein
LIIPNFNSNGTLVNYTLTKREIVTNGYTRIFKRVIGISDVRPFLEVILPEDNVLSIESIITLDGTNFNTLPTSSQFSNQSLRWYEVDALAENKVFVEDYNKITDNAGVKPGKWITVDKKFITEYTDLGFTKIIFGSGTKDTSSLSDFDSNTPLVNQIGNFINNNSLGQTPTANTTMYVKYRIGGGSDTNVGPNILRNVGLLNMTVNGTNQSINSAVKNSLVVNNTFPALGGKNAPSVDEIRYLTKYNFASQNRAVTIKDYQAIITKMPGQFGIPFRMGIMEEQNKIKVYIVGLDQNSKLSNNSTSALRDNIASYLSDYRMINDYVQITNGKIINLSFEIDLFIDKKMPQAQIMSEVINNVKTYMDINKYDMGDNVYLSPLIETINNVGGVLNVIDVRVYNKIGEGKYSLNEISQPYLDAETRQIDVSDDYTLFGEPTSMFEIKFPTQDIMVRVK